MGTRAEGGAAVLAETAEQPRRENAGSDRQQALLRANRRLRQERDGYRLALQAADARYRAFARAVLYYPRPPPGTDAITHLEQVLERESSLPSH